MKWLTIAFLVGLSIGVVFRNRDVIDETVRELVQDEINDEIH